MKFLMLLLELCVLDAIVLVSLLVVLPVIVLSFSLLVVEVVLAMLPEDPDLNMLVLLELLYVILTQFNLETM